MALRSDIQSQIIQLQAQQNTATAKYNATTAVLFNPLSAPGTDANGNKTLTLNDITYSVTELTSQYTLLGIELNSYKEQIDAWTAQLSLATTVDTLPNTNIRTNTTLRNYQHAKRIFVENQYRLSPKYGFLFYVEFDFNPAITNVSNTSAMEMGMIIKSVNLPKFTVQVKEHNAYNRKNLVQNSIKYDPVNIVFHDDQADNVRNFWYDYYSFYYRDPDYADATYTAQHKYQTRSSFEWGYTPRPSIGYNTFDTVQQYQYIQAIRIYSMYQGNFSEYELINPIITSFKHGEHTNESGASTMLEHTMAVQFETVKYLTGSVTSNTVGGFDLHYDHTPSINGGTPHSQTSSDTITDLANNNTAINPFLRTSNSLAPATFDKTGAFAQGLGGVVTVAQRSNTNSGGITIPSLGDLTQGLTSSAVLGQQLKAAGVNIVGSATASLSGGVVSGIAAGLGKNGTAIVSLAAAAISNPNALLKTGEAMATNYVIGSVTSYINNQVSQATQSVINSVTQGTSYVASGLNSGLSFGGASTFTGGLQNTYNDLSYSLGLGSGSGFQNIDGINVPFSALND